ncbi:TetR/AcrR family transcriptional regulator [Loktanella sp. R86503]|uniref:TetR/AcrR family transcriptional regulator n=1 Tax=Loktanella sp. R86503 TaxID=3093847 RepID=UPI0036D94C7E
MKTDTTGGRPVNAHAGDALKAAALRLVRLNGYDSVSITAITKEAGVARQTLYNRWNTKADLVLDAVFEETQDYAAPPREDDPRSARDLIEEFLIGVFSHLTANGDILRALIAAAQLDASFQTTFYSKFVHPRERMITELLDRAKKQGELATDRDPDLVSSLIHGAFWYRLLNRGTLDAAFAKAITADIFN